MLNLNLSLFVLFLPYGQHFLICDVKQDLFGLVKHCYLEKSLLKQTVSLRFYIIRDGTLISPILTCFKKFF